MFSIVSYLSSGIMSRLITSAQAPRCDPYKSDVIKFDNHATQMTYYTNKQYVLKI